MQLPIDRTELIALIIDELTRINCANSYTGKRDVFTAVVTDLLIIPLSPPPPGFVPRFSFSATTDVDSAIPSASASLPPA